MRLRINGYPITAEFGGIDGVHQTPHTGVDIAMPEGTPLQALTDGIVEKVDTLGLRNIGEMVRVHPDGGGPDFIYGHLSEVNVKVGDQVRAGDVIALSGNTGHSTGPHLHLQLMNDNGTLEDPTPLAHLPAASSHDPWWSQLGIGFHAPKLDPMGQVQHFVAAKVQAVFYGILEGIQQIVMDIAYPVTLFGGGLCILLQVAGWEKGYRWAGLLGVGYVLIRYFFG